MGSNSDSLVVRRRALLASLRATRSVFLDKGDVARSMKVELGIQILLDHKVSDRMIELLEHSAAVAARDAVDVMAERH